MGTSRRRRGRRLDRPSAPLPPVAPRERPWLLPALALLFAAGVAALVLSLNQLANNMPGNWFELLGGALLLLSTLTLGLLLMGAWRRHREGNDRRALLPLGGALAAALLGVVAVAGLVENAQIAAVISGADVHLTRPIIESLPRPPGTRLLDERAGLADTESISQDLSASNLDAVVPFYQTALARDGWVEDKSSASTEIVRFTRGSYVISIALDPASSGYTLTVDHLSPSLLGSPSPSATTSPS